MGTAIGYQGDEEEDEVRVCNRVGQREGDSEAGRMYSVQATVMIRTTINTMQRDADMQF